MQRGKSGIYAITCNPTGKRYIGQSASIGDRWLTHRSHLARCRHANRYLQSAWDKHGQDAFSFDVLEYTASDRDALSSAEQAWVDRLAPAFNLAPVAGSTLGLKHPPRSDKFRKSMGDMKRGLKHKPETIEKLRQISIGKAYRHSPETLALMAAAPRKAFVMTPARVVMYEARRGKPISQEHREALLRSITGRSVSESTKAKIGEANSRRLKGSKQSAETIAKRTVGQIGKPRPQHVIDSMVAGRKKWLEARRASAKE